MALILALDDDRKLLKLIATALEPDGHALKTFSTGDEAVGWLKEARDLPELILLDLMMPNIDGHTFLAFIEQNERTKGIPVIITSAHTRLKKEFENDPRISSFVAKPFGLNDLRSAVSQALSEKKRRP